MLYSDVVSFQNGLYAVSRPSANMCNYLSCLLQEQAILPILKNGPPAKGMFLFSVVGI